jgi:hypothetical protein
LKRVLLITACAALAAACTPQKPKAPAAAAGAAAKFDTDLPMAEFMDHVVDPGAFMYWKGSGSYTDMKGEHSNAPTTEEGWETLVSGATIVMEAGNLLQLEGRGRAPLDHWNAYAQRLTAQGKTARAAADKHDEKAVFEEGAKLYQVCVDCHEEYVIQPMIKANGPAKGNPLPDFPADVKAKMAAYAAAHKQ